MYKPIDRTPAPRSFDISRIGVAEAIVLARRQASQLESLDLADRKEAPSAQERTAARASAAAALNNARRELIDFFRWCSTEGIELPSFTAVSNAGLQDLEVFSETLRNFTPTYGSRRSGLRRSSRPS